MDRELAVREMVEAAVSELRQGAVMREIEIRTAQEATWAIDELELLGAFDQVATITLPIGGSGSWMFTITRDHKAVVR